MANPPADIPASELWLKLSSRDRPSKLVDFPRMDENGTPVGRLRIRVLTQEEQMSCSVAAEKTVKDHMKDSTKDDLGYERLFSDAYCVEILFRACRDENDVNRALFPGTRQLRSALSTEECAMLFQHYQTVSLELGPMAVSMSEDELEAWVAKLAEGGSAFPFDLLSSDLQRILILYTAQSLMSQKGKPSAGSLPEESSPSDT